MISVRAQAAPDYAARVEKAPAGAAQTYVFAKGRMFSSLFDDRVRKVSFDRLTEELASGLSPRFTPARRAGDADLIIVVHWGAVARPDNSMDTLLYDPDSLRQASNAVEEARTQASAAFKAGNYGAAAGQVAAAEANYRNELNVADTVFTGDAMSAANSADLLGLRGLYRSDDNSLEADQARSLVEDDRYFVSLIAYDAGLLRLGQKRVVWTARMSAPLAGRDFATAVREMSAVAAPLYGTQQPRLILQLPTREASAAPSGATG